ncbi:hypothetical protein AVEN_223787-1 [Araneus ventricosus]|uniref:Uncharacterized protein n=1 Tax=Araneus ventricosus TaxID=182803 RepID=A0A4Y2DNP2_ARAVE|nr:hypothetical protein AVEN_223787-1 [Araneus ventricosus]
MCICVGMIRIPNYLQKTFAAIKQLQQQSDDLYLFFNISFESGIYHCFIHPAFRYTLYFEFLELPRSPGNQTLGIKPGVYLPLVDSSRADRQGCSIPVQGAFLNNPRLIH